MKICSPMEMHVVLHDDTKCIANVFSLVIIDYIYVRPLLECYANERALYRDCTETYSQ